MAPYTPMGRECQELHNEPREHQGRAPFHGRAAFFNKHLHYALDSKQKDGMLYIGKMATFHLNTGDQGSPGRVSGTMTLPLE